MRFGGFDISAAHWAIVVIGEEGDEVVDVRYVTEGLAAAKAGQTRGRQWGTRYKKFEGDPKDTHLREMHRLHYHWAQFTNAFIDLDPDFGALEDYAYGDPRVDLAEVTGLCKLHLWSRRIPFRLWSPKEVKMFAAHNGNANDEQMTEAVEERWGQNFASLNGGTKKKVDKDVIDAYVLARMCRAEWLILEGHITPKDLEHKKEIQIFLRTSKRMPTNVLGRSWTCREATE